MYYYVFLENNIVTWKGALPSQLSGEGYMEITAAQYETVQVGMMYVDGEFVTPSYRYAILDPNDVVESIVAEATERTLTGVLDVISISTTSTVEVGMYYDRETQTFVTVDFLTADEADDAYAPIDHTHSGYAASDHTHDYAATNHTHSPASIGAAAASHTHDAYASSNHTHTPASIGAAAASHSHAAADVSGVVKSINGQQPDSDGNVSITVSSGAMSGADILTALSTVDGANSGLDADKLDGMEASSFATASHTHTEYAATDHNHDATYAGVNHEHTGYAAATHNHDDNYAEKTHTHSDYAASDHTHSGYAAAEHTHSGYASSTHNHDGTYATTGHTHSNYASSSHTHSQSDVTGLASALNGKASSSHTHSEHASSSHTHSGYASSSHTHSDYLSTNGGTVSGELNVTGILKIAGQQAFYNSGSYQTIGTNNAIGGTTVACGSSADMTLNGANVNAPNIVPRNSGTFSLGSSSNRWSNIYSKSNVNVSSDERLKEDISSVNHLDCLELIKNIDVSTFRYLYDNEERIGVIAQQLLQSGKLAPLFVTQDEDGYYGVKTADLVFPLIAAVQYLILLVEDKGR